MTKALTKCTHQVQVYLAGNTYCNTCGVWLHAGLPEHFDQYEVSE